MGGLSFGTETTIWTAMRSDALAAASVSSPMLSPQLRLLAGLQGEAFEQRLDAYWQLGGRDEASAGWRSMSPAFNLDRFRIPLLMQMPEQEYMHVLDYAIPLIRSGLADMYVFPHEPHQKFQPRHKLAVYGRNLDWFRFWLQGYEDPDPAKARQYARWREMKEAVPARAARSGARQGG
jgi:dipeptidyl aminopeptidase/acylaminoacyl peptidase